MNWNRIITGDCRPELKKLRPKSVHMVCTSPPYWGQRDYEHAYQIGSEAAHHIYVEEMIKVFDELHRVLRDDGVVFLNIGDKYGKDKQLLGIPWLLMFQLQGHGWTVRQECVWYKRNTLPTSQKDRCTLAHESVFLITKQPSYYFDPYAIMEPAAPASADRYKYKFGGPKNEALKNGVGDLNVRTRVVGDREAPEMVMPRSVWDIPVKSSKIFHFAQFPKALAERCILAGTSEKGCCPMCGTPHCRQVDKQRIATRPGTNTKIAGKTAKQVGNRDPERHITIYKTVGWHPVCQCIDRRKVIGCTVLDPFSGSGTTCLVAKEHHRRWLGIELNPEYAAASEKRINNTNAGLGVI